MSQFSRSELVSLAELCYHNYLFNDAISYMKEVMKMGFPLNYRERLYIFGSYLSLKKPLLNTYYSYEGSNLNEKLREELQTKEKTAINRI